MTEPTQQGNTQTGRIAREAAMEWHQSWKQCNHIPIEGDWQLRDAIDALLALRLERENPIGTEPRKD